MALATLTERLPCLAVVASLVSAFWACAGSCRGRPLERHAAAEHDLLPQRKLALRDGHHTTARRQGVDRLLDAAGGRFSVGNVGDGDFAAKGSSYGDYADRRHADG